MARTFVAASAELISLDTSFDFGASFSIAAWSNHNSGAHRTIIGAAPTQSIAGVQFRVSNGATLTLNKSSTALVGNANTNVTAGVWSHAGVSYDGTNFAFYLNGAADGTGSNAQTFEPKDYSIGNNADSDHEYFDGSLAEVAIWDAILNVAEFASLGAGYSPRLIRPENLVEYVPLVRDLVSIVRGVPTATGTTVSAHPRVIMSRGFPMPITRIAAADQSALFRLVGLAAAEY